MKAYLILERAAEYDDSTYDIQDEGKAVKCYRKKEKAESVCEELNTEKNKGIDPTNYGYGDSRFMKVTIEFFYVEEIEVEE